MSFRLSVFLSICVASVALGADGDARAGGSKDELPQSRPTTAPTENLKATSQPSADFEIGRPKTPAAAAALREYEQACQAAEDAHIRSNATADRKLIDKLKPALIDATKKMNLDEATLIDAQIKAATARLAAEAPVIHEREPSKIVVGPSGGLDGQRFETDKKDGQFVQIRICSGNAIDSLTFTYLVKGRRVETERLGGAGGIPTVIDLVPGERIIGVFGTGSDHLHSLGFITNHRKIGPFGEETGGKFAFTLQSQAGRASGYEIGNFFGFAGATINSLGVEFLKIP